MMNFVMYELQPEALALLLLNGSQYIQAPQEIEQAMEAAFSKMVPLC